MANGSRSIPIVKRIRVLAAGVLVAGCATSQSPVSTPPFSSLSGLSSTPPPAPWVDTVEALPVTNLRGQLLEARTLLEGQYNANPKLAQGCFEPPLLVVVPTDLGGLVAESIRIHDLFDMGASVVVRFVDPVDPGRWAELQQGMVCSGVMLDPPAGSTDVEGPQLASIPGIDSETQIPTVRRWNGPDGSFTIELGWSADAYASPGTGYQITSHNLDEQTVINLAASAELVT